VEINGAGATLSCGNYRLPVAVGGVQVDCEVTKAYYRDTNADHWALVKDVVVGVGKAVLDSEKDNASLDRQYNDTIWVLDERGWYHRYTHLYSFDPSVKLGGRVDMGQFCLQESRGVQRSSCSSPSGGSSTCAPWRIGYTQV
jgi:hypothetical protein